MTDDIKDIVERLNKKRNRLTIGISATGQEMVHPVHRPEHEQTVAIITALTTLSEDNAAMKLEIERLKDDILEIYETVREQAIIIKNLKDTP